MPEIISQLQSLRQSDTDVALILDLYEEVERVYKGALEAMGAGTPTADAVRNSADVTISFEPGESAHSLTVRL
ncbi:MAG TPA: hypothetical protein VHE60_18170 [Pyrinomonadaceae bacterium]|nr:hypothetical protein [Pyrinomonadaceae bacterium]